jgi:hypothetical protein
LPANVTRKELRAYGQENLTVDEHPFGGVDLGLLLMSGGRREREVGFGLTSPTRKSVRISSSTSSGAISDETVAPWRIRLSRTVEAADSEDLAGIRFWLMRIGSGFRRLA